MYSQDDEGGEIAESARRHRLDLVKAQIPAKRISDVESSVKKVNAKETDTKKKENSQTTKENPGAGLPGRGSLNAPELTDTRATPLWRGRRAAPSPSGSRRVADDAATPGR